MAIKERVIKNLTQTENDLNLALTTNDSLNFENALKSLMQAKNLSQNGLTEENYKPYAEIYDGLLLAFQNLIEVGAAQELLDLAFEFLSYLKNQIALEKSFKKELVFLPIQAAMWDSLESVWKAAYDDTEHCIAYVIPLPYANCNRDDSINEWHTDRNEFPKYVPTIHFEDIDLEEMHPDVIFINNPYDGVTITLTQDRFFSDKLKDYTDKLIYIPYFILAEPATKEGVRYFALTYGVLYSDQIILQSEDIKKHYIDVLVEEMPSLTREYWENKIIAAGSPKVDKVLYSKKEDFTIPSEWLNIVKNKKVILYLTSLKASLKNIEKVTDKLRYVFKIFKDRDDVALWWRPHPLLKNTLHYKYPEVEKEYLKLEQEYIEAGFGIYDDTGDLHRAICYSDAYYGDPSSVVTLYKYTGKPIMIQNFNICE